MENVKKGVEEFFNLPMEEKKCFYEKGGEREGLGQLFVVSEEQKLGSVWQPQYSSPILIQSHLILGLDEQYWIWFLLNPPSHLISSKSSSHPIFSYIYSSTPIHIPIFTYTSIKI